MPDSFDIDDALVGEVNKAMALRYVDSVRSGRHEEYHRNLMRGLATLAGRPGDPTKDVALCDACMDRMGVVKAMAVIGHTDEGDGVKCVGCGFFTARLTFEVPHE